MLNGRILVACHEDKPLGYTTDEYGRSVAVHLDDIAITIEPAGINHIRITVGSQTRITDGIELCRAINEALDTARAQKVWR